MKLHLPSSLRKALMAVLAGSAYFTTAEAGCMHAGVSPTIYTDFGQNMGRYSVYQVNELLSAITARDGILIPYTTGAEPGRLPQDKMISFEGMNNDGAFTAVGYNYTATVAHNGCPNPSFTPRYLGEDQAIHYQGVEYRSSENRAFLLQPNIDYKLTRSSKIFTDITASGVFDTRQYLRDGGSVLDLVHYRAGAGSQEVADFDGNTHGVAGGYAYITGGVVATLGFSYQDASYDYNTDYEPGQGPRDVRGVIDDPYTISVHGIQDYGPGGAGQPTPDNPKVYLLPFVSRGGDSGSPVWAWDAVDEEYKLISCHQARGGDNSYSRGASQWTIETMESFNQYVDMDTAGHTVHMFGAEVVDGKSKHISDSTNHVETTTQYGHITGGTGFDTVYFCGVGSKEPGTPVYTWLSLYDQKDVQNWYSYGNTYFNANGNGSGKQMHLGDLFNTENVVFKSAGGADNHIILDQDVDTGIGYVQFTPAEAGQTAKFYLESNGKTDGRDYMLNTAGYIVDAGAELHIQVTNTQVGEDGNAYFREWRKQGAGDMYLEGRGNNEVFLNLGGKGTTYLREKDGGYAAYNVLINNGATVNFGGDITQIARDVTFGNGGGYLEFSGLSSFDWYSGENANVEAEGFTINALTQDATLVNSTGSTTLHYKTGGETTFLGSFQDTENSTLNIIYEGGGTWTLNSIHTHLQNAGSAFTVANGTVELAGTNTVHALGSIEGKENTRYSHPDDWHYSDAEMDVVVQRNATFRLGSHARLTGDVTVQTGGILEIAEGVKHRFEYIEGWLIAEDTTSEFYRGFYGLKGNVNLAENSLLRFNYSSGTDAENVYGGNITGAGNVDLQLGSSGATLVLSGNNTFTGTKTLSGGGLVAESTAALGNTADNKWHVNEDAFIAVKGSDGNLALQHIDTDSTGVIALTQDQTDEVDLNGTGHQNMIVGALAGQVVQYGEAPVEQGHKTTYTEEKLSTVELDGHRKWQLGGGGGELVVNFLLEDSGAELVLGNEYTTGTVTLTNIWNQIGSINFAGQVTLNYTSEEALGGSKISLGYANRVIGTPSLLKSITRSSDGVLLLDKMPEADVDLTDHHFMALGSDGDMVYSGSITPTAGGYRFGGITGTLELQNALTDGEGETRGLIVDGQGYAGGTLALATKATLTGDIVVTGHDSDRHPEFGGGDIALRLDVDDAIADARSITLKEGGSIDINGTSQTFRGFNTESGSMLVDTSEAWNGSATIEVAADGTSRLLGGVEVANLVKSGAGTLELGGSNVYNTLLIHEGSVLLKDKNSLSASGIAMIESGGVLDATEADVTGAIGFAGGKLVVGDKQLGGSLAVAQGYDGRVEQSAAGMTTNVNSTVDVAPGGKLTLAGENGTFRFSALDINEAGGTIELDAHYLTINKGGQDPVNVGGTISLKGYTQGSDRATLYSDGSSDNMTRNINELHIAGGNAAIQEASWNTIWNIHSLTGDGDLQWTSNTTHWYSARVVLDGANSFTGQFTARRNYGNVSNRGYQSFVEARHDLAMQNMDVALIGNGAQSNMALAVNTDNLQMRSLSGNQYALLYAGAALEGADHDTGNPLQEEPQSTRRATLTITGEGDHTFSGNVTGQDHYEGYETREDGSRVKIADVTNAGISLMMNGSGTQTFNGGSTRFNNVTVNSGKLVLDSANLTVKENVSITRGAELQMSQAYELGSGKTLTVLANAPGTTAKLSGLTLNGGIISFSAEGLSHDTPALTLGSLGGNSVTITFTETYAFTSGVDYFLADQDWSGVNITEGTQELSYLTASYRKDASGLYVSFTTKSGNMIWGGTDESHDWNSRAFGTSSTVPTPSQTAVFNDAAANHHVNITGNVSVAGMVFDASGDYDIATANSTKVTAGSVVQSGSGTTTLTGAVQVGTSQKHGTVTVSDGELRVTAESVLQYVDTITGAGTLGVDFGSGSGTVAALFAEGSSVGALHVVSGTFTAGGAASYETLVLDKGAAYQLGADQSLNMVVGTGEREGTATLNLANHKITSGTMEMQGDLTVMGGGSLNAAVVSNGHTVNTRGTLTIGNTNFDAGLSVAENGKVTLTGGAFGKMGDITLGSSSTLQLDYGAGITSGASIAMGEGSTLNLRNGAGGSTQVNADIVMTGNSATIMGSIYGNGTRVSGSILGQGTLHLAKTDGTNSWRVDSTIAETEDRPLALDINSNVTLAGANTYSGGTTITGFRTTTDNVRALGTGTLAMNGGELYLTRDLAIGGLEGTGGNILLNNKQITIDSARDTRYSGDISGGSLVKLGGGSLELAFGGGFSDVTVGAGTLLLGSSSIDGKISVARGATLDITGEYYAISRAVDNAGTVKFSNAGTVLDLGIGAGFEVHTNGYRDVDGQVTDSGNGFAQGVTVQVFNNAEGAAITGAAPEIFYLGDSMVLDAATGVASKGASNAAYSVRTGTVVYDDAFAAKEAAQTIEFFSLEGHSMDEPATLRLSRNLADGVGIMVSNYGGNIELDQGVVLSADRLEMQSYATLTGSGTFVLDAGSSVLPDCVLLGNDEQWTGAVRISGNFENMERVVNALDTAGRTSSVELMGVGGYLGGNVDANIILSGTGENGTGTAVSIGNGSSGATREFKGSVGGNGDFVYNWNNDSRGQTHRFSGDVSQWRGSFIVGSNVKNATAIEFTGNAKIVNASVLYQGNSTHTVSMLQQGDAVMNGDITRASGTVDVVVGNGSAATNATFNGSLVDVSSLQVKAASSATLAGGHNTIGSLIVEGNAMLSNTGSTVLSGSLANNGSITNSGALDLGTSAASVGSISNSGTLTIGTKLTAGAITNSGTIVISSLMTGTVSGYVDANGKHSDNGNGFATTSLTVLDGGIITNSGEGRILYGGNDVTTEVLTSGSITSQENRGTYYIKSSDSTVTYTDIARAAKGALEYIQFKSNENTALRVDSANNVENLRTSQVYVNDLYLGSATLNMETGSILVVDASTTAKVNAAGGSTITLEMAGATPETRMTLGGFTPNGATVNVTGSGVLDIGGGQYNISTLNITGGTVLSSFAGSGGSFSGRTDVNITQGGRLQLAKVDALGWASNLTKSITIAGDDTASSALELGFRQTLSGTTAINMNGNAVIRAMAGYTGSGENLPMLDAFNNTPKITATGTGNIVAVPLRMRTDFTFDIAANGELTLAGGTASGYRGHNIVKNGGGKLIFDELQVNFGEHTYEGGLNINAGSVEVKADATFATVTAQGALAITSGTTTITAYTGSNGAAITVGRGAELALNANATLAAAISNSGTVSFGADCTTLTLNGNFEHADNVYRDLATGEISEHGNGLMSGGYVTVLSGDGNVALHGNVNVSYNSKTYALQTDGRAYLGSDATTYYVRTGEAVYNSAVAAESAIKTVALSGGAMLDMQVALADGVEISSTGGKVNIGEGVLLSRESITAGNDTILTGGGTYELNLAHGTTRGANISLGDAWDGTIRVAGETSQTVNLNTIASRGDNDYAALEITGATLALAGGDIHPDLMLNDKGNGEPAMLVANAGNFNFHGDISGSGTLISMADGTANYAFTGADLSGWNGTLANYGDKVNVSIAGMGADSSMGASLMFVDSVAYTGNAPDDVYTVAAVDTKPDGTALTGNNGTLKVASLSGVGALTVNGSVELAGGEYRGSDITVSGGATLTLGGVDASAAVLHANGGNVVLKADSVSVSGLEGAGSVAAADSQPHTLALHGGGNYSSGASIGSNIDLEMNGGGTQTLTGDLSAFNGDIYTVNGTLRLQQSNATTTVGVLNMSGGNVEFGAGETVLDAARVVSGTTAAITVQHGASVALNRSIQNSGSLTLSGTLDVGNLTLSRMDTGFIDTEGRTSADGSGFVTSSDSVRVVRNIGDGSLVADDAMADYKGEIVAISQDGLAVLNRGYAVAADTYYVRHAREDAVAYSDIAAKAVEHGGTLAHLVFDREEAYLTLDSQVDLGVFSVEDASVAHVEVTQDGRLDMGALSSGVDGSMLLNGAGRVQLEDLSGLARNVQLTDEWHGTVVLTGSSTVVDLGADSRLWVGSGDAASSVEFNNWHGTLAAPASDVDVTQIDANVVINGMTLDESSTGANLAFNNTVSGQGNLVNNSGADLYMEFHGDTSRWNGSLVTNSGSTTLLLLAEHAEVNNAILKGDNGNVTVSTMGAVRFNSRVQADMLVAGDGEVAIASDFDVQNVSVYGSLTVEQGGRLSISGDVDGLTAPISNSGAISFTGEAVQGILLGSSAEFEFSDVQYTDLDHSSSATGNGFRTGGTATLIQMAQGATLAGAENVIVSYRDQLYTLLDDGSFGDRYGEHTYYIHQGTVNYSDLKDVSGLVGLHLDNTLVQGGNATLNLNANLASTVTNGIVSDGGTVSIAQGVTLQRGQLDAQGATTLTGQGTYDLGSGVTALGDHISLGGDWRGIVRISDAHMSPFTLSNYANNHSSVEVLGISGWWNTGITNFSGKLILGKDDAQPEKVALKLTDASSNYTYSLNGGVSGRGDYVLAYDSNKRISATTHVVSGDVSDWTGSFIDAVEQTNQANTTTLKFLNNTAVEGVVNINASVLDLSSGADHKLNVYVDQTASRINMNGSLAGIDKLTYKANGAGRVLHIEDLTTNAAGTMLEFENGNYPSTIEVNNLGGTGILSLHNNNKATGLANFAINGGDYSGERIDFTAMKSGYSDSNRCVLLTIGDEHVAENSVIHTSINKNGGGTVNVGIGVNDATVRVGGLTDDAYNVSGTCVYSLVSGNPTNHTNPDNTGFTSDGTVRTLVIVGNGGSTRAKVGANLNITMDSAGHTQSFTGDMGAFTGAIDVQAGTLDITSTGALSLHAVNVEEGGTLAIAGAADLYETITNNGSLTINSIASIDHLAISELSGFEDGQDSVHNGFLVAEKVEVARMGEGAVLNVSTGPTSYKGKDGTFDAKTGIFSVGTTVCDNATFYVNTAGSQESLSHAVAKAQERGGQLTRLQMRGGTALDVSGVSGTIDTLAIEQRGDSAPSVITGGEVSFNNLALEGAVSAVAVEEGAKLKVNNIIEVAANLTLATSGEGTFEAATLRSTGGRVELGGTTLVSGGGDGKGDTNNKLGLAITSNNGTIAVNGGVTTVTGAVYTNAQNTTIEVGTAGQDATLVATRIELGDNRNGAGTLTVGDNGKVVVTGDVNNRGASNLKNDSLVLGEWSQAYTTNVQGSLYASDAIAMLSKDAAQSVNVQGGTMAVKGVWSIENCDKNHNLSVTDGGRLILGESGIAAESGNWNIKVQDSEIGMTADTTIGRAVKLVGNVTVNTDKYEFKGTGSAQEVVQGASAGKMTVSGAVNADASATLSKAGAGTLEITGSMAGFHGSIDAQGGILELLNQNRLDVQDVTIADGATVSAYVGTNKLDEYESTLTISGTLAAKGANGKLNANVVMETGSTLDASATGGAGIALGSSLTIRENIHLSDADFEAVAGLGYGESYILFNGVDSLTLDQTYTGEITPEMQVDAAGWFHGVEPEHIYMVYDGSNVGLYCMVAMPEPATSTLSLLALAALAARRRRK